MLPNEEQLNIEWDFPYHKNAMGKEKIDTNIFPFALISSNAIIISNYLISNYESISMIVIDPRITIGLSQKVLITIYTTETTEQLNKIISDIEQTFKDLFSREDYWDDLINFGNYFNVMSVLDWSKP